MLPTTPPPAQITTLKATRPVVLIETRFQLKKEGKLVTEGIASGENHGPTGVVILSLAETKQLQERSSTPQGRMTPLDSAITLVAHLSTEGKTVRLELTRNRYKPTPLSELLGVATVPVGVLTRVTLPKGITLPDDQELFVQVKRIVAP
jgi:hypothetical protein